MAGGASGPDALRTILDDASRGDDSLAYRQLIVIDAVGQTAVHSGARTLGTYAEAEGQDCVSAGNLLATVAVPAAMIAAFVERPEQPLGARLLAGLAAGLRVGGEAGAVRSAVLVVVDRLPWPLVDLRVDWHADPIREVAKLWEVWSPQAQDYVLRALEPWSAPSFHAPGDP